MVTLGDEKGSIRARECLMKASNLAVRHLIMLAVAVAILAPRPSLAVGCADWVQTSVHTTGTYVPAEQAYARPFAFGLSFDCNGSPVTLTVQRAMGGLPICEARQSVEVVGTLSVSSKLMGSVYQIIDPTSVKCLTTARSGPSAAERPATAPPVQVAPPARAEAPRADASSPPPMALGPSAWVGRYTDNRGTGEITFTLMRGESTVSGTWKMRTGGGGPVTGLAESSGGRVQLRLENIAADCPGLLEGSAEITDSTFTATYQGRDCQGEVTGGRLEMRPR
jgi:hypothetical protein